MNLGNTISKINLKKVAYDSNKYGRAPSGFIKVFDKEKGNYTYELALEWAALGIKSSDKVNFNCSINLNDENMDPSTFCGFQITNGIYNEKDQKTKSGMAYAISMIFEGEGGNSKTAIDNKQPEVKSNTEKPDDKKTPKKETSDKPIVEKPKEEEVKTSEVITEKEPEKEEVKEPIIEDNKTKEEIKPEIKETNKQSNAIIFILIPVIIISCGVGVYFYIRKKK